MIRSAIEHRMEGLLWRAFEEGQIALPSGLGRSLAVFHLEARRRHETMWDSIAVVTEILDHASIGFVVMKGVANEGRFYERIGDRSVGDLDIWIGPPDRGRFGEALRLLQPDHELGQTAQQLLDRKYLQSVDLVLPTGIVVDLHSNPFNWGMETKSAELMWNRRQTLTLPGRSAVQVLDVNATLALALIHLNLDGLAPLPGFLDVHRILKADGLSISDSMNLLRSEGLESHGWMTLSAVQTILGLNQDFHVPPSNSDWWWNLIWRKGTYPYTQVGSKWRRRGSSYAVRFTAKKRTIEALRHAGRRILRPIMTDL